MLIPVLGPIGAAIGSSISYGVAATISVLLFARMSGELVRDVLIINRADMRGLRDLLGAFLRGSSPK